MDNSIYYNYTKEERLRFSRRLPLLRTLFGITQEDLAAKLNVSRQTVSAMESSKILSNRDILSILAVAVIEIRSNNTSSAKLDYEIMMRILGDENDDLCNRLEEARISCGTTNGIGESRKRIIEAYKNYISAKA